MTKMEKIIRVVAKEGKVIEVQRKVAEMSKYIKDFIEEDTNQDVMTTIEAITLENVFRYCHYIKKEGGTEPKLELPLKSDDLSHIQNGIDDKWFIDYVDKMAKEQLWDVASAANFLDIPSLFDLASAKIATNVIGKSPTHIGEYFGIVCDHSAVER